jgi:hypothetical protein
MAGFFMLQKKWIYPPTGGDVPPKQFGSIYANSQQKLCQSFFIFSISFPLDYADIQCRIAAHTEK